MAIIMRFSIPVITTMEAPEVRGVSCWIDQKDMPGELLLRLRRKCGADGWAWSIYRNQWFCPKGEEVGRKEMRLGYDALSTPCIIGGPLDFLDVDE